MLFLCILSTGSNVDLCRVIFRTIEFGFFRVLFEVNQRWIFEIYIFKEHQGFQHFFKFFFFDFFLISIKAVIMVYIYLGMVSATKREF